MLLWFRPYKSCHHSTALSLAKTQLPIAGSSEKALNFFFFWISHCQLCELWSSGDPVATFSDVCWSGLVSAGTSSFVLDPTTVTRALSSSSAQFDFRMLNAKSREERINLELRLCACHCQQCNDTHTNDYLLFCPGTWRRSFSACNTFWMCSYFGLLLNRCRCRLTLC